MTLTKPQLLAVLDGKDLDGVHVQGDRQIRDQPAVYEPNVSRPAAGHGT
ncbi:hypothetical protein ACIRO3_24100 [Streptomyces sp. NPDC102278]